MHFIEHNVSPLPFWSLDILVNFANNCSLQRQWGLKYFEVASPCQDAGMEKPTALLCEDVQPSLQNILGHFLLGDAWHSSGKFYC